MDWSKSSVADCREELYRMYDEAMAWQSGMTGIPEQPSDPILAELLNKAKGQEG